MKQINYDGYLTEEKLGNLLIEMFGEENVTSQFKFDINGMRKFSYDHMYVYDNVKYIIEFDGMFHFQKSNVIRADVNKNNIFRENDLPNFYQKVIRIPYFIQLTNDVAKLIIPRYEEMGIEITQDYPHGFIDTKCVFPADWSSIGEDVFVNLVRDISNPIRNIYIDIVADLYRDLKHGNIKDEYSVGTGKFLDLVHEFGETGTIATSKNRYIESTYKCNNLADMSVDEIAEQLVISDKRLHENQLLELIENINYLAADRYMTYNIVVCLSQTLKGYGLATEFIDFGKLEEIFSEDESY
jgi:hypothetical protein